MMKLGANTFPFGFGNPKTLDEIITWAGENGLDCLEVCVPMHLDVEKLLAENGADALNKKLAAAGVSFSSLARYNPLLTDPDPTVRAKESAEFITTIEAADALGVDTICCLAGMAMKGKRKMQTIQEDLPGLFEPLLEEAGKRGIRIALENWYPTNLQHLGLWRAIFEVLPHEHFGLNFDPSHLIWQGIDYIAAVDEFASRIFHTHAKDTVIDDAVLRQVGVLEDGWWRYSIPGTGRVAWGEFLGKLRQIKYDGVVSVEHEDYTLGAEEGLRMGINYLRPLLG